MKSYTYYIGTIRSGIGTVRNKARWRWFKITRWPLRFREALHDIACGLKAAWHDGTIIRLYIPRERAVKIVWERTEGTVWKAWTQEGINLTVDSPPNEFTTWRYPRMRENLCMQAVHRFGGARDPYAKRVSAISVIRALRRIRKLKA